MNELDRLRNTTKVLSNIIQDLIVTNQAAWIEYKHGKGAEAGMQWIENGLLGPGQIPDESDSQFYNDAQLFFNEQKSNPFPVCPCGNPSSIKWMEFGYCCDEHQQMHKEKLDDDAKANNL